MGNNELKCPICGEPTYLHFGNPRKDRLCRKHGTMERNGEIVQCLDCQNWHNTSETCHCDITTAKTIVIEQPKEENSKLICLTCDRPSNGKHFCYDCFKKYKNKVVYLKIKNCTEFDPLGSEYESDLVCEDGHIVKSEPERNIDNWLFNKNIKHIYEKKYPISDTESIHPDWCLPGYIKDDEGNPIDVFIEYWGIEGSEKYEKIKNYKLPIYKKDKVTLVNINAENDKRDISAALDWKIGNKKNIKPYISNFEK